MSQTKKKRTGKNDENVRYYCKKRDGKELSSEEIEFFIRGYTAGEIPDYQASALLMAAYLRGLSFAETDALTSAVLHSGSILDLSDVPGIKADKHSTGGVGDGVSLAVAPLAAACGVKVAMMSGRGLGHTGGTLDKLESIEGYNCYLSPERFRSVVESVGCSIIGQTEDLAPADKKLYALRDVTATVNKKELITASILGKKLAEGINCLVLDVKTGSGAFMKTTEEARALAALMVRIAKEHGVKVSALITDMDCPLGNAVGNSLEVIEAIECLKGRAPEDYTSLAIELAARMLYLAEKVRWKNAAFSAKRLSKTEPLGKIQRYGGCARRKYRLDRRYFPVSFRRMFPHRSGGQRRIYFPHRYRIIRYRFPVARRRQNQERGPDRSFRRNQDPQKDGGQGRKGRRYSRPFRFGRGIICRGGKNVERGSRLFGISTRKEASHHRYFRMKINLYISNSYGIMQKILYFG